MKKLLLSQHLLTINYILNLILAPHFTYAALQDQWCSARRKENTQSASTPNRRIVSLACSFCLKKAGIKYYRSIASSSYQEFLKKLPLHHEQSYARCTSWLGSSLLKNEKEQTLHIFYHFYLIIAVHLQKGGTFS